MPRLAVNPKITDDNTQVWEKNGKFHREDGPAVIWEDGYNEWWFEGKRHRVGGPAVSWPDGQQEWWLNNARHREDGPAIENLNTGFKRWFYCVGFDEKNRAFYCTYVGKKYKVCGNFLPKDAEQALEHCKNNPDQLALVKLAIEKFGCWDNTL